MTRATVLRGALMVCGTASDAGKSHVVTGLCRLLARRGVQVAPFKAQNMSLNSYVTASGHEISRAQATQAVAAGLEPEVGMNPVLLKPSGRTVSHHVVMGRPYGGGDHAAFRARSGELRDVVHRALADLRERYDVVICEGAGGAAEINLMADDMVNLPLAAAAGAPAILVGDIERGGVFASLYGTLALVPEDLRRCIKGFVVNKMRGDAALLEPGLAELERRCGIGCLGVIPWLDGVELDAEDSLALERLAAACNGTPHPAALDVALIRLPRISNFTDMEPLVREPDVRLRLVADGGSLGRPDLIVIPGTRTTLADLAWLRSTGLDAAITAESRRPGGAVILGICGGQQMLGHAIVDGVESASGRDHGLGLLEVETEFRSEKVTRRLRGRAFGETVEGYRIHHGRVRAIGGAAAFCEMDGDTGPEAEGAVREDGRVVGTSLHGLFECDAFRRRFLAHVAHVRAKAFVPGDIGFHEARRRQHDKLADALEEHLDTDALCDIIASASRGTRASVAT